MRQSNTYPLIFFVLTTVCQVFSLQTKAQSTLPVEIFYPEEENPAFFQSLSQQYEQVYKTELDALPSQYRKDYQKAYQQRWEHIRSKFTDKEIYQGKEAQAYLDALVNEIVTANPLLKTHTFRCYFSRSGIPNASYIGQGIILFNMGLFQKLNNESEVAFILSHEIAHFLLKHSENSISAYVNAINSQEVQSKLREIKKSDYRKREEVDKLVNTLTFSTRRHSRNKENEADSMAIELMRATRFDLNGAISALDLLDRIDNDTLNISTLLEKIFHFQEYPFQKKWLKKEEGLLGGHTTIKVDSVMADSLKTHPDCRLRIAALQSMISKIATPSKTGTPDPTQFELLKHLFPYEIIQYYYNNNYTRSFYYTLELLEQKPNDPFLIAHTGRLFNGIYTARKEHKTGKLTDLPSPSYSAGYNTLLQFMQNLYMENISALSYYFLKQHRSQLTGYDLFNKTFNTSTQLLKQ